MSPDRRSLRTPPVQRRASDRIDEILAAAAEVVDEVGPELLTTTLVAERAGAGVGTVYRYFPDRLAILQGLADRNVRVLGERFASVASEAREDVLDDLTALFHAYVDVYRDLPGYRSVRTGEWLPSQTRPRGAVVVGLVDRVADIIGARSGAVIDADLRARFVDCFHVVDAVVAAAFVDDPAGDEHLLDLAYDVARAISRRRLGLLPSRLEVRASVGEPRPTLPSPRPTLPSAAPTLVAGDDARSLASVEATPPVAVAHEAAADAPQPPV
ncbi:TetR/AcrR family transcriptional regulator [Agrococcus sp. SGAir0287]|uniref:TetR/AcrR family transcriptional regulator n=1 Tax=Agrococcus sp. SGAir0287 TaxID=2070347 RepID=UPI0010CD3BDF|nr:TetR/AcrR family transcriptional regulator [Agrococcus sp. SGAir0287]QCR20455.1 TetR/AcrR family transcriptional regulator [Agrococcus sp. SGAir0287]